MKQYFLYFIVSIGLGGYSQELPPIKNYSPREYAGEYQNWDISQTSTKTIFTANHMSLLEFDGSTWHKYQLPEPSIIRSVKVVGDSIYTGSYKEFGYWKKKNTGELSYTSLSDQLSVPMAEDEEFWEILPLGGTILFQSLDRIYIYDLGEKSFKIIDAESQKAKLGIVNNQVYFQITKKGLFTIRGGQPVLVSDAPIFIENTLVGIYEHRGKLMVVTDKGRFYLYDFNRLSPWPTEIEALNVKLYESLQLKDSSFVLGSIGNGFYHLSPSGKLTQNITQAKGLNNNTVLSIFEDLDGNLWLGLDNGISVINLHSPINEYIDRLGNLGLVYAALAYDGYLYLGTNQGLFARKTDSTENFQLIKGTEGQVWSLQLIDNTVFCGHNNGTFEVSGNSAKLISDFPGAWGIRTIGFDNRLLLQGNYNGLSVLERKNGAWGLRNTIEGFSTSSRFFEIDSLTVIVNHEQKGLYQLELDKTLSRVKKVEHTPRKGHGANIFRFNNAIYYKTHNTIYQIKKALKDIYRDSALTKLVFNGDQTPTSIITPDTLGQKLWYFSNCAIHYVSRNTLTGKMGLNSIPISGNIRRNLGVSGFENISPIGIDTYLIGSSNGYITLDLNKVNTVKNTISINAVINGKYSDVSTKNDLNATGTFDFTQNNLKFTYAVPEFDKYTDVQFQYKLKGLYEQWSDWSESPEVVFNNLPFGSYEFTVRAQTGLTPK